MKLIKFIPYFIKNTLTESDFYFLLGFLFAPYFVGIPVWYLMTDTPQPTIVEIFAPWFVGLLSFSIIPFALFVFFIITWPLFHLKDQWKTYISKNKNV